ncbi:Uncharacterised protein [Photobacterium damselae]|uniref:Uncharacterized protein n=1 Tax=Photobacterium damselae TaxID=38293 RepID=A0A2X1XNK7_PHODM|nr:Uncharacterised protein [Photobacterium damselae]
MPEEIDDKGLLLWHKRFIRCVSIMSGNEPVRLGLNAWLANPFILAVRVQRM